MTGTAPVVVSMRSRTAERAGTRLVNTEGGRIGELRAEDCIPAAIDQVGDVGGRCARPRASHSGAEQNAETIVDQGSTTTVPVMKGCGEQW